MTATDNTFRKENSISTTIGITKFPRLIKNYSKSANIKTQILKSANPIKIAFRKKKKMQFLFTFAGKSSILLAIAQKFQMLFNTFHVERDCDKS